MFPLFALLAFSAGCGSENGTTGSAGAGGSGGSAGSSGTGGSDAGGGTGLFGAFTASILDDMDPAYTKLVGQIYDGPQPPEALKLDSEEGGCQLLVPNVSFCMGGCPGGECVAENTCQPYPAAVDVGLAHITGFTVGEIEITPTKPANVYQPTPTLPPRACAEGGALEVRTDKFTLQAKCVASLELMTKTTQKIPIKSGTPLRLVWTAPSQATLARVAIHLDISHHGGKKGEIDCDVADTGSFEIPATLITKLVSLGLAGFPTIDVTRIYTSVAANEPNVKFKATSDVSRDVDTGVMSCMDDKGCPAGQTCQRDLTCK